jgi:hypothetical protein
MWVARVFVISLAAFAIVGCVSRASMETLHQRAAFELECPPAQIRTMQIDDRTVLVQGCDQRATYVETCERSGQYNENGECHWVLDHKRESRPKAEQPPAGPPLPPPPSSPAVSPAAQ